MKIKKGLENPGVSYRPFWVVFITLTGAQFLLSYSSFPLPWELLIFLLGVVTPLWFWVQGEKNRKKDRGLFDQQEFLKPVTPWAWVFPLAVVFFSRFWKIGSLFCWPTGDEGLYGSAAIQLNQKWDWSFFYTAGQNPPTIVWLCALFFKYFKPALFDLWIPAALISLFIFAIGLGAARQFFSRSFSWVCAGLLAFSYWPLYLGRFCHPGILVPLGEFFLLFCLGKFLKTGASGKKKWSFVTGLAVGLQSLTFAPWPVVSLAAGVGFWCGARKSGPPRIKILGFFLAGIFLALIPFLNGALREGYGRHILTVAAWNPSAWREKTSIFLGYFNVLGLGLFHHDGFYVPERGGFLNPLLVSLFYLGLVQLWNVRSSSFVRWFLSAGALFLLPGILSLNVEGFRIIQILPWLVVVTAWGFQPLLEALPSRRRILAVAAVLLFSFLFDGARMVWPFRDVSGKPESFLQTGRSLARYRAYLALKQLNAQQGPGWVLGEWDLPADRTLQVGTYFFNAAYNPDLESTNPAWMGVILDAHYRPFLEKRFPEGRWRDLDSDFSKEGNRVLGIVPVDDSNRGLLRRWARADQAFRDLNWGVDHVLDKDCLERMDRTIRGDYPLVKGDPFLESCFWEKIGQFYYYYGNHLPEQSRAMELALQNGYPAAQLFVHRAELLLLSGNRRGYEEMMRKAHESETLFPWRKI